MAQRQMIAIDIDDVVADTMSAVQRWANTTTGAQLEGHHYRTSDPYWDYYNSIWRRHGIADKLNFEEFLNQMATDQSHIAVQDGAREVIEVLKQQYDVIFLTSRPPAQKEATRRWLDERIDATISLYIASNPFTNAGAQSKGEICAELGVNLLIDDSVDNCTNAADYGVTPVLFGNYGWNERAPGTITRCATWYDVREYLQHEA
ncbi:MAG TPA: hypothetical protein VN081_04360 [Dongiaceae bacterium]|nr:hypothetical protein [Dongiaceae bacterium]